MAFYVTRGCLDGWFENSRRRCETLLEAAALAEIYDYADQDLVLVEDENGNDLHYYSSHFDDFKARAAAKERRRRQASNDDYTEGTRHAVHDHLAGDEPVRAVAAGAALRCLACKARWSPKQRSGVTP